MKSCGTGKCNSDLPVVSQRDFERSQQVFFYTGFPLGAACSFGSSGTFCCFCSHFYYCLLKVLFFTNFRAPGSPTLAILSFAPDFPCLNEGPASRPEANAPMQRLRRAPLFRFILISL